MKPKSSSIVLSKGASRTQRLASFAGTAFLFAVTSASALAVLFIFYYIARDALPFFRLEGMKEFFTSTRWYPSSDPAEFGTLSLMVGSILVTAGAVLLAVPLGVAAAVCLSDIIPFRLRQVVKPVIEILAAIPSVAYGFFALVVFAPLLQQRGGQLLSVAWWMIAVPVMALAVMVLSDILAGYFPEEKQKAARAVSGVLLGAGALLLLHRVSGSLLSLQVVTGANALNVSVILGVMALPTVVSVSEDALQAVGRDLREGSYALGATRAETIMKVVIPAAISGICAAAILGIMRAVGETMVVWMASGNAAQIPEPWYNLLDPVRTMTATIAGEMGEADHVTGSSRYHVLFALALVLLSFCFLLNLTSEWIMRRSKVKMRG